MAGPPVSCPARLGIQAHVNARVAIKYPVPFEGLPARRPIIPHFPIF